MKDGDSCYSCSACTDYLRLFSGQYMTREDLDELRDELRRSRPQVLSLPKPTLRERLRDFLR